MCNDAQIVFDAGEGTYGRIGEPTEAALSVLVEKLGVPGACVRACGAGVRGRASVRSVRRPVIPVVPTRLGSSADHRSAHPIEHLVVVFVVRRTRLLYVLLPAHCSTAVRITTSPCGVIILPLPFPLPSPHLFSRCEPKR